MKILIVTPGPLYPVQGMSQVRIINQINALSLDHEIIFSDVVSTPEQKKLCRDAIAKTSISYQPIQSLNYGKSILFRMINGFIRRVIFSLSSLSREEISVCTNTVRFQLCRIASKSKADAVLIHYWYLGCVFRYLPSNMLKMIDTHYVVEENMELQDKYKVSFLKRMGFNIELKHSLKFQRKYFCQSDLIIVNSVKQETLIHEWNKNIPVNVTINGQDLSPYLNFKDVMPKPNCILFYGALSNQFNRMALERILSGIMPIMQKTIPDFLLYVVGNNPPQDILSKYDLSHVVVTGHVDDIMPYISLGQVMLLPLDTGSGFRGRIVEVMSLGVPIVGTENALQSVDFVSGKHGYIAESDQAIADKAISILLDESSRAEMSQACKEHAIQNFSLEHTFGKLSKYLFDVVPVKK